MCLHYVVRKRMCRHVEQQEVLFLCSQNSFLDQVLGQSLPHVLKLISQLQWVPSLPCRNQGHQMSETSEQHHQRHSAYRWGTRSNSGLFLQDLSPLYVLALHQAGHHRLGSHFSTVSCDRAATFFSCLPFPARRVLLGLALWGCNPSDRWICSHSRMMCIPVNDNMGEIILEN